jgi:lysine 6-dehydrogenase
MRIAVIGAGAMGRWCVKGLARSKDVNEIVIGDIQIDAAERLAAGDSDDKARAVAVDAMDEAAVADMLCGCDAVVNAAQHTCVTSSMKGALRARVPYTDLGGFFHLTRRQFDLHDAFVAAGVPAVIAMGSAPGITNILAKHAADHLDTVEEVHARCGSLDRTDWSGYRGWTIPYSLETLCEEFGSSAVQWIDGVWREMPGASGEEDCDFGPPLGVLRAYFTLHSEVATFYHSWVAQGLKTATWKLALPPDFTEQMRFLTRIGLTSKQQVESGGSLVQPRALLAALLRQMPSCEVVPDDTEVLMSVVRGVAGGRPVEWRTRAVVRSAPDMGAAAGDIDTGVPPTIVARALARGEIDRPGVWAPEQIVDTRAFFTELAEWGIVAEATCRERLDSEDAPLRWQGLATPKQV